MRVPILRSIGTKLTNLENMQKSYVLFDYTHGYSSNPCLLCVTTNRTKVKCQVNVTKNTKTSVLAITFDPEVVETSDWLQRPMKRVICACFFAHQCCIFLF